MFFQYVVYIFILLRGEKGSRLEMLSLFQLARGPCQCLCLIESCWQTGLETAQECVVSIEE